MLFKELRSEKSGVPVLSKLDSARFSHNPESQIDRRGLSLRDKLASPLRGDV